MPVTKELTVFMDDDPANSEKSAEHWAIAI